MKTGKRLNETQLKDKLYMAFSYVLVILLAILFTFPLYWIITGSFKNGAEIGANPPVWWPSELNMSNFERLMDRRTAPLFEMPLGAITITGPKIPGALRWLINTVFMSVTAMLLTCLTSAMAGYVLAKKNFWGRGIIFGMIVCAMALPKQVILIPLIREMKTLHLYDTIWAVIFPIVGWPFGVFLLKQFAEGIPGEMVEAARIDGAGEFRIFFNILMPSIKPGWLTLIVFAVQNFWNQGSSIYIYREELKTLSYALGQISGAGIARTGVSMAIQIVMMSVPVIVFVITQSNIVETMATSGMKD